MFFFYEKKTEKNIYKNSNHQNSKKMLRKSSLSKSRNSLEIFLNSSWARLLHQDSINRFFLCSIFLKIHGCFVKAIMKFFKRILKHIVHKLSTHFLRIFWNTLLDCLYLKVGLASIATVRISLAKRKTEK